MAISALSSSLSLSKAISVLSPSTPTSKTQCQSPHKSKTHPGFPLSSPSISLYTQKNPRTNRNGGLTITSMIRTFNVAIPVEEDEPADSIIRRFNRQVLREGVFEEFRRRQRHENPRERRIRKAREAMRRNRRRNLQLQSQTSEEDHTGEATPELFARIAKQDSEDGEDGEDDVDEDDVDEDGEDDEDDLNDDYLNDDYWNDGRGDLIPYSWR